MNKAFLSVAFLASVSLGLASFPPYVKKQLYATHDIRGHKAPRILVEKWVSGGAPVTKGKTVLIDLWATWCPSCRQLIPEMNHWNKQFAGKLVIIGVSDENASTVKQFLTGQKMDYHVAVDPTQRLEKYLGVQGIPHVLVISPDGIVRWQGFPGDESDELTDAKLASIIKQGESLRS